MKYRILTALLVLIAAGSLWAHHSTTAVFDMGKKVQVTGVLNRVEWINPHIVVTVDAKGENWRLESNPPSWFRRVGVNRGDFAKAAGQTVTVEAVRAKDGTLYGYMQKLTLADGTSWELVPEKQ